MGKMFGAFCRLKGYTHFCHPTPCSLKNGHALLAEGEKGREGGGGGEGGGGVGKGSSYAKNEYNLFYKPLDAKYFHVK